MRTLLAAVAIVAVLATGCLGSSSANPSRPNDGALTRQIEARQLPGGWSLQDVRCLIASHGDSVSCRAILREVGDSFTATVTHAPIRVAFHLTATGQLGSAICDAAVAHDNPFC